MARARMTKVDYKVCNKNNNNNKINTNHVGNEVMSMISKAGPKFKCNICNKLYKYRGFVHRHMVTKHKAESPAKVSSSSNNNNNNTDGISKNKNPEICVRTSTPNSKSKLNHPNSVASKSTIKTADSTPTSSESVVVTPKSKAKAAKNSSPDLNLRLSCSDKKRHAENPNDSASAGKRLDRDESEAESSKAKRKISTTQKTLLISEQNRSEPEHYDSYEEIPNPPPDSRIRTNPSPEKSKEGRIEVDLTPIPSFDTHPNMIKIVHSDPRRNIKADQWRKVEKTLMKRFANYALDVDETAFKYTGVERDYDDKGKCGLILCTDRDGQELWKNVILSMDESESIRGFTLQDSRRFTATFKVDSAVFRIEEFPPKTVFKLLIKSNKWEAFARVGDFQVSEDRDLGDEEGRHLTCDMAKNLYDRVAGCDLNLAGTKALLYPGALIKMELL